MHVIIVPRWYGRHSDGWYSWIENEITERTGASTQYANLPDPDLPSVETWPNGVRDLITNPEETIVVGHSIGNLAVLHALAGLPEGRRVHAMVAIAGWFWTDDSWPTSLPWYRKPIQYNRIRQAAPRILNVVSTNDPYTSNWQANQAAWTRRLGATVRVVPGGRHFTRKQENVVLDAILSVFPS